MSSPFSLRTKSMFVAALLAISGFAGASPSVVRAIPVGPCGTTGIFGSSGPISSCTYTSPGFISGVTDQFAVPVGVTALYIEAVGGVGGPGGCSGASGGKGSSVAATYSGAFVLLNVVTGGAGVVGGNFSCGSSPTGGFGGLMGGGQGGTAFFAGGGGGGASSVSYGTSLLIVAAGGGGGGGGNGGFGGDGDKDGHDGGASAVEDGHGGTAGTPAAIGLGGSAGSGSANPGGDGGVMVGGSGGSSLDHGGGGGGEGYRGGGGGGGAGASGAAGGGGGGASFFGDSAVGRVGPLPFAAAGSVKISWGFSACSAGYYSTNGYDYPNACTPADTGHYAAGPGATSQTACLPGFFAANTAQTQCDPATKGHYVDHPASDHETACLAGFYQANTAATSCLAADIGFYVDTTGADHETACPAGKTTSSTGSDSASDCVPFTPYQVKQNALAHLKALLPTGSAATDSLLNRATVHIDKSLVAWRWIGQDALTPTHGWAVFNHERKAVGLLSNPALAGNATVSQAISDLLAADRTIVVKAIAADSDSSETASANATLARADQFVAAGRYSRAILALRAAWLAVV